MAVDIYRIPHASSVYVDRTKGRGVLHVITSISEELEKQKQELIDALQYTVPRLGLSEYKVHWNVQNTSPLDAN